MSGKIVGMVFDHYPASGNELLLAVKLADNAHDDGTHIFPAVATLATLTRQSERSVQYQIRRMLATGWLVLVREARGGGRGGGAGWPREYRINPTWIKAHDSRVPADQRPTWVPNPVPETKKMGANPAPISDGKWVQPRAEMGATAVAEMGATAVAPEPSITVIEPRNPPTPHAGGAGGFDAIAAEYPRRARMALARKVFDALAPGAELQAEILRSIRAWSSSEEWQREGGRYVPKLADFLRDRRWLDMPGRDAARSAKPAPPAPRVLTCEELADNKVRASEAAAYARKVLLAPKVGTSAEREGVS